MVDQGGSSSFYRCTSCGHVWRSRGAFLSDPEVVLIGYQPNLHDFEVGYFYFTHMACGTTVLLAVGLFRDLDGGAIFEEPLRDRPECQRHCLRWRDLRPCESRCECVWVRRLMQTIQKWEKSGGEKPSGSS